MVGPDSGPLTIIVSRNPIYVTFPVSQREFLKVQEQDERKKREQALGVRSTSPTAPPMTRLAGSTSSTSRSIARLTRCWYARQCPTRTAL